jgi:hypothetical protein
MSAVMTTIGKWIARKVRQEVLCVHWKTVNVDGGIECLDCKKVWR